MPIIELKDLHKRFGHQVVLDGVSLAVEEGRCLVILGASGSGKSVILKHMVGLLKPDSGGVWFKGERIDTLPERNLMAVRQHFGFLFQMGALFDSLNVFDNIAFPLVEHTRLPPEQIRQTVTEKLSLVGLSGVEHKMPGELSGGQRKRVALARAIVMDPEVILYDEPTTGLDPIRADVINELINKLEARLRITSIVVTHDMQSAFKVADRMVMLHEGKLIFDGTPEQIQKSREPIISRFVNGEASDQDLAAVRAGATGQS